MKAVYFGCIGIAIALITAFVTADFTYLYKITGLTALLCLALAGVTSGVFVSGQQYGRNVHSETKQTREERYGTMLFSLKAAVPNIGSAILFYLLIAS